MCRPRLNIFVERAQGILFDFDGTLVDTSEAVCMSFNAALRSRGLAELEPPRICAMIGRPLREMFARSDPAATEERLDDYVAEYRAVFFPASIGLSKLLPGVTTVIPRLAQHKKLAIVTNRMSDGAFHILRAHGLHQHFKLVIGSDRKLRAKPFPDPLLCALEELGIAQPETSSRPGWALMVGDTPDDIHAGQGARLSTVGVTTGAHDRSILSAAGADWVISTLEELL